MSLSVGELKKVSVQSIRDIAAGLRAKATSMRATKTGVTDLPHKGTWTGTAADNADHEIGTFGNGLGTDADAYENAAAKVDRAGDEFEGLKQLLTKLENEAAGKFSINEATGEVTPLSKDFNKADRDYIANTLKQLCAAGGQANDDLAAGIHATDASGITTPANATGALPTAPNSAVKPDGVFGGVQNLATANPDGEPGATKAAAAAGADTQANYKEWYPRTPGSGDKLTIDPSKAGSLTGTVGALEKLPGAPKPADGFGSGVARQFGQGVNSRVDGIIDEAKNLTGQGAPGSPGVAESWAKFALGTADQMANPLGSLPGEVKEAVNDPAGFAGKKLFDVSSIAATGPLGGEAAAGARGLLGDLTGAETRALTHGLDDAAPGHHTPPTVDHPAPNATLEHQSPNPGSWNHSTEHYSPHAPQLAADLNNAFTNGHPTSDLAAQVADHSTHHAPGIGSNANPDRVVLGKWDGQDGGYIGEARNNGGIYFDTGDETWNAVGRGLDDAGSRSLGWQVNEQFLRA
ncbi:endonuclease [Mycobacteroides abscessus]|nr:endonuclease [Mycobacteroides abscessus]MBL3736063.1 endonuclease [Mycobacteroides abscessus subsp. massiliense]MBL3762874.1 endonuclease [Mycobacteroides abscessus subsp. massiliense]MBN7483450.1 endonuclease [Mycobacteroides abscessus subsp. massiliense]MDB2216469.1 endonuclease [Mycobacteroides abscessus subsp. massiliense]MDM2136388.1 endonuclease [Mycobacteroides abscessus]